MTAPNQTAFRRALGWDEVPLPPGYDPRTLEPGRKEDLRLEHEARKEQILAERALIVQKCEGKNAAAERRKILALCGEDPAFFIEHFGWTYDDRVGTDEPMVLYPFQQKKIVEPYLGMVATTGRTRWTQCVTKSRGVGWTWTELFLRLHSFLFRDNWSILVGSVGKDDVDDGGKEATQESLFGKLRYAISKLPPWMRETLLGPLFEKDPWNHRHLLKNPFRPRNIIVGRHFSGMFGRSQRFSEVWGDEIAWADAMKDADKSLKQTTNRFVGGSTPMGKATFHYQLMTNDMAVVRIWIHWSEHPELDVGWYNEQRQHMTDEDVASELDCSFEGSAGGRVLKEISVASHFNAVGPAGEDLAEYQPGLPLFATIDPGIMDDMAVVWDQWDEKSREPVRGRVVDFVQTKDRAIDWIVPFFLGEIPRFTADGDEVTWPYDYNDVELAMIERHKGWGKCREVFGDHYGTTRSLSDGFSAYDVLAKYGIDVCPIRITDDQQAIVHLQFVLRHYRFARRLIEQRNGPQELVPTMAEVVTQWRYPRRKAGDFRRITAPVKDQYDAGGDCLKIRAQTIDLPEAVLQHVASGAAKAARGSDLVGGKARWRRR